MTDLLPLDPFHHMLARSPRPGTPRCEAPLDVKVAAYDRDRGACRYCGFRPENRIVGGLDLHHLDHDHGNDAPGNLAVACAHCHGAHHAAYWASRGQARIVWMPEVGQAGLSILARAAGVAEHAAKSFPESGPGAGAFVRDMRRGRDRLLEFLEERARVAAGALGTDDPGILHSCLDTVPPGLDLAGRLAGYRVWVTPVEEGAFPRDGYGMTPGRVGMWLLGEGPYGWIRAEGAAGDRTRAGLR